MLPGNQNKEHSYPPFPLPERNWSWGVFLSLSTELTKGIGEEEMDHTAAYIPGSPNLVCFSISV